MKIIVYRVPNQQGIRLLREEQRTIYIPDAVTQYRCRWLTGTADEKQLEEQKELLRRFTREGALENRIVIFIPEEPPMLKEWFSALWNTLFNGKGERLPPPQPYDDDHLGGKEEADRYKRTIAEDEEVTEIEFIQTFMEERNMPVDRAEFEAFLSKIAKDENNEVDAIFVTTSMGGANPIIYRSALQTSKLGKRVEIDKYGLQVSPFTDLIRQMSKVGELGNLEEAIFHFKQGVVSITRLGDKNPVYLFFVSMANDSFAALADVAWIRREHLEEITNKLRELGKIS